MLSRRCKAEDIHIEESRGLTWMADPGQRQVDDPPLVVDAVPEAACARYLVLPLLQHASAHRSLGQIAFQRMLPFAPGMRISSQGLPGRQRWPGCLSAELLPAFGCRRVSEAKIPLTGPRRRRYSLAALGHRLARRRGGYGDAVAGERPPQLGGERWIGVDGGRGLPLANELSQWRHHAELGGRLGGPK